jgi:CIC family chloride channel protein
MAMIYFTSKVCHFHYTKETKIECRMPKGPSTNQKRLFSMKDPSNRIVDDWQALFANFFIILCISMTVFFLYTALQWAVVGLFNYILSYFPDSSQLQLSESDKLTGPLVLLSALVLGTLLRTFLILKNRWYDAEGDGASAALAYFYDTYNFHTQDDLVHKRYAEPTFLAAIHRSIVTFLTVGTGGSGGLEGPAIPIGESMGAGWSKLFRIKQAADLRLFQMAGISAAICALLDMPFMAALFAAEIVYSDKLIYRNFHFSLFASLIVYFFNTHLIAIHPLFQSVTHTFRYTPIEYAEIAMFAVLICAPSGLMVKWLIDSMKVQMDKIPLCYRGLIGILCAFAIAMILWFSLDLSPQHVLGMGESTLVALFENSVDPQLTIWWILLILMFAKLLTTAFTLSSGGSAGLFIPAMFMGGVSAASLYYLLVQLGMPLIGGGPSLLMVAGVCSALVSVIGVPLAAIAFAFEGFGYEFGPSAIISVVSCYFFLERLRKDWFRTPELL